jgi:predicted oxidoreductase (fatty acid repression mutant protein)
MASNLNFLDAVAHRRSIYALTKSSPISDDRIEEIVSQLVKDVPSSFNSQSSRLVLLLKDEHDKFWDIVRDALKAIVPEDKWESTGNRIAGFRAGYGTVSLPCTPETKSLAHRPRLTLLLSKQILFYESHAAVQALQAKIPAYADKFPEWSEHTSAMHQFAAWTALEAEGLGANLQHYNPLPDQKAAQVWDIPADWQLKAQLVFGGLQEGAREKLADKASEPIAGGRLFVHGKSA